MNWVDKLQPADVATLPRPRCATCAPVRGKTTAHVLLIVVRSGHRNRHSKRFTERLESSGWRVETMTEDGRKPHLGVPNWCKEHGKPSAWVCWEEHGCLFVTKKTRALMAWSYREGIAPLCADFGYLDHYHTYLIDRYDRDGVGLIGKQWDAMSGAPIAWAALDPRIQRYRQKVLGVYETAKAQPPLREPGYVAVWTQFSPTLSRLKIGDKAQWPDWCREINRRLSEAGERAVFKSSPVEKNTAWPPELDLIPHDKQIDNLNARLAVHAKYNLLVCSSITNEFVLAGLPVLATGRSWFAGRGIFTEAQSWEDIGTLAPTVDEAGRNRYLRWWLRNECYIEDVPKRFCSVTNCVRAEMGLNALAAPPDVASVTCIYAPNAHSEAITLRCLQAVKRELPNAQHIAGIDLASDAFARKVQGLGFEIVRETAGRPPRMRQLLKRALDIVRTPYVWTVESDVILQPNTVDKALATLRASNPRLTGLGLEMVDEFGAREFPTLGDFPRSHPWDENPALLKSPKHVSFCASIWRTADLRTANWSALPQLMDVDKHLCVQLRQKARSIFCHMPGVAAIHLPHTSRKAALTTATPRDKSAKAVPAKRSRITGGHPMHSSSYDEMRKVLEALPQDGRALRVLDVGSMSVNSEFPHTYREHVRPEWNYTGCDIAAGANVDLVQLTPYRIQGAGGEYDVVISGQCLEHVEMPWMLAQEMARMLKPGGVAVWTAPWKWSEHKYPLDCWRILPDGMTVLMQFAGLQVDRAWIRERDCWGIGKKALIINDSSAR